MNIVPQWQMFGMGLTDVSFLGLEDADDDIPWVDRMKKTWDNNQIRRMYRSKLFWANSPDTTIEEQANHNKNSRAEK